MKDLIERNNSATRGKQVIGVPRSVTTIGRNDTCPCGSGKKYKKCCGRLNEFEKFNIQEKIRKDEEQRQSEEIKKYLISEHAARKGKLGLMLSSVEATYIMQYPEVLENYIKTKWKIVNNVGEDAKLDEKHDVLPDGVYEIVFLTDEADELVRSQDAVILIVAHYHEQLHSTRPQVEEAPLEGELIP